MLLLFKVTLRIKKTVVEIKLFITFTKATSINVLANQEG